jgi:hypothetical protein
VYIEIYVVHSFFCRYWLRCQISDNIASTTCIIFDDEVRKLLKTSISDLLESLQGNIDDVPKVIQELYGKLFIFRFKLNEINVTEGRQGYLVKRHSSLMISLKKIQR